MYDYLRIEHFKSLKKIELKKINKINIIVGKNNVGKTTLLEALFLLTGFNNPNLLVTLLSLRNNGNIHLTEHFFERYFYNLDTSKSIILEGKSKKYLENSKLLNISCFTDYNLYNNFESKQDIVFPTIGNKNNAVKYVYRLNNAPKAKEGTLTFGATGINMGGNLIAESPKYAARILSSRNSLEMLDDIDDLISKKKISELINILKKIDSKISNIAIGKNNTVNCDIGMEQMLPINLVGDGLLKAASIISAVLSSKLNILLIDEIENGLHYSAMKNIWKGIISGNKVTEKQLFITTHSDEALKMLIEANDEMEMEINNDINFMRVENENKVTIYSYEEFRNSILNELEVR